ncbi:MAG TPA: nucleotidyltransferase family protein [Candidatus Cloacimonadota bacterium]|nr:nucleotidyltransferase family protein [Candidatus Cloacimonadota bacterium]
MLCLEEILSTLDRNALLLREQYYVQKIGVFGSYARGAQQQDSDIDFLVEFSPECPDLFETKYNLRRFLQQIFEKKVDLANIEYLKPYIKENLLLEVKYAG